MPRYATKEEARQANAAGRARKLQMQAEDEAETRRIAGHLLDTLRRPRTIEDELRAQLIGRTATKISRLEEQRRNSISERTLLESLLHKPFNSEVNLVGPRVEGSTQQYFTVTKGDNFIARTEPVADEATAADERDENV
jgi:hypothetical protein